MARDDLRYRIGADTAGFDAARKRIEAGAAQTAGILNRSMGALSLGGRGGLAGIAAAAGIGEAVKSVTDLVREIDETARAAANAGVNFEVFQELQYVLRKAGGDGDNLAAALKEMTTRSAELVRTGAGPAKDAMEALGFTAADLTRMLAEPDRMLETVIGRLKALDRASQVKFAEDIFGNQAGEDFVRLLDQSIGFIGDMRNEARATGTIIEDGMVDAVRELNRAWVDSTTYVDSWLRPAAINLLNVLVRIADVFRDIENMSREGLESGLADAGQRRLEIENRILQLREEQRANASALAQAENRIIDGQIAELQSKLAAVSAEEKRMLDALDHRDTEEATPDVTWQKTKFENPDAAADKAAAAREKAMKATERERQAVLDLIDALEYELSVVSLSDDEKERENAVRRAGTAATAAQREEIRQLIAARQREEAAIKATADAEERLRDMTEEWADRLFDVFGQIADGTFDARKALAGLLTELAKALLLGKGLFAGLFGSTGGGALTSILSAVLGGIAGKASGGPVSGGTPYLVGEAGPELFVPSTSGTIVPNGSLGASSRLSIDVEPSELFVVKVRQVSGSVTDEKLKARDASSPARVTAAIREARTRNMLR